MTTFDVIVIGSGAGGSPVAAQAAAAGAKVLVIERGRKLPREGFDRDEIRWCRRDGFIPRATSDPHTTRNGTGKRAFRTTNGWISTVVGGGTVHMGAYLHRAQPADAKQGSRFAKEPGHSAIDWAVPFDDVAKQYPIAEDALGVSGVGTAPPIKSHVIGAQVDQAAKALGLAVQPTPRGILTSARPKEGRMACAYHGMCASYGCPNGAKASMPASFLQRGEKTGNLTLWSDARVIGLVADAAKKSATGVRVVRNGQPEEQVKANVIVVAAGAIESARLLLLSGEGFNPGLVGKNLWFSLFVEATGFFSKEKHPEVMVGDPFVNRTVQMGGGQTGGVVPNGATNGLDRTGALQVGFVHDNPIHRAERVATQPHFIWGASFKKQLHRYFTGGRALRVEGFGESLPHPGAFIDLDPRTKDSAGLAAARITHFHHERDRKVAKAMAQTSTALLQKMGAENVLVPHALASTWVLQGGTCRFANTPEQGVTDPTGRVFGLSNVFVSDGGALPSSLCAPSTLTIVANALRISAEVIRAAG